MRVDSFFVASEIRSRIFLRECSDVVCHFCLKELIGMDMRSVCLL